MREGSEGRKRGGPVKGSDRSLLGLMADSNLIRGSRREVWVGRLLVNESTQIFKQAHPTHEHTHP